MNHSTPSLNEDRVSQTPALQFLQVLGYTYLTPQEALELRGSRHSNVILDRVLEDQLRKINRIEFRGESHAFSEANIQAAVQALKSEPFDGLVRTNEKLYDLLCLGKAMQQSIYGDIKSFTLNYIDWEHPENNVFHVTEEFVVERTGSRETRRPDIVLFVNGIPFVVIECKSPAAKSVYNDDPIDQAISQHLRNQHADEIPRLFLYAQLLLALSGNEARYGTVGTPLKFWSVWKEDIDEAELQALVDRALRVRVPRLRGSRPEASAPGMSAVHGTSVKVTRQPPPDGRALTEEPGEYGLSTRLPTAQDRTLFALCRPERLLQLTRRFVLFDAGEKKIARYQQYFCVKTIMERIRRRDAAGRRQGGVVWHTQGSGKSL
ncbi:MAG: type I restriction endonuclease subunit R, partial [Kiritimatiellaeota bacterium]|nr:type I restriction endonuclease subunit R [Kiritimatiellota bacterium]